MCRIWMKDDKTTMIPRKHGLKEHRDVQSSLSISLGYYWGFLYGDTLIYSYINTNVFSMKKSINIENKLSSGDTSFSFVCVLL